MVMWLAVGEIADKNDWIIQGFMVVRLCGQKKAGG
jgi:hypothetical protein